MSDTLKKQNRYVYSGESATMNKSGFNLTHSIKTTMLTGRLVPLDIIETLPGDTFTVNFNTLVRSITPAVPVIDNSFLDIYFFYAPNRILCYKNDKDWAEILGENVTGFWAQSTEHTLETKGYTRSFDLTENEEQSLLSYLGVPAKVTGASGVDLSVLPMVGYFQIWNEWFRDQNTQSPIDINTIFSNDSNDLFLKNDSLLKVNKIHDLFTSCLPSPQKGDSVLIPLLGTADLSLNKLDYTDGNDDLSGYPLVFGRFKAESNKLMGFGSGASLSSSTASGDNVSYRMAFNEHPDSVYSVVSDLSTASGVNINQLRLSVAIQRFLERDARGGTRYREMMKNHFGVTLPEGTIQIPEYLGGKRISLNVDQVLQTSGTTDTSPLGTTGAFSNTFSSQNGFTFSCGEYGFIYCVACVRTNLSYSQGLPRLFRRFDKFSYYWPTFANIGEQPIYNYEQFLTAENSKVGEESVFGYNEAWIHYRDLPNKVTGFLQANSTDNVLKQWTYQSIFKNQPTLNNDYMYQNREPVDNTLVVTDSTYHFIVDFCLFVTAYRTMPVFSIPGFMDHN